MSQTKNQICINRYKAALLCGNQSKIEELEKILKEKSERPFDEIQAEVTEWAEKNRSTVEEAAALGKAGEERLSLKFQIFLGKVKKKKDEALLSAVDYIYSNAKNPPPTPVEETCEAVKPAFENKSPAVVKSEKMPKMNVQDLLSSIRGNSLNDSANRGVERQEDWQTIQFPASWKRPFFDSQKKKGIPKTPGECMYEYCFYGLRTACEERDVLMSEMLRLYRDFGGTAEGLKRDKEVADEWLDQARKLIESVKKEGWTDTLNKKNKLMGGPLFNFVTRQQERENQYEQSVQAKRNHVTQIQPVKSFDRDLYQMNKVPPTGRASRILQPIQNAHPNDITQLKPAASWDLFIDESGKKFSQEDDGIIGGVLFDTAAPLPKQDRLHASEDSKEPQFEKQDKAIQAMLHSPCGILVLPVKACQGASGWGSMIGTFIDLVLRLIPLGDGKSTVNVYVEKRSPYETEVDCAYLQDACRFSLMQTLPERAAKIEVKIHIHDKTNPWNAYPDLITNSCLSQNEVARKRFRSTGWAGTCFLNYPSIQLRNLMDIFLSGQSLDETAWNLLLNQIGPQKNSFIHAALKTIGEEVRGDIKKWTTYLDYTLNHLNSKALDLKHLSNQLDWLTEFMPLTENMPPRLKLTWLTAKLAEANHMGEIEFEAMQEFKKLILDLYEEDAPLTCWATLHLAVNLTNAYRFAEAQKIVREYSNIGSLVSSEPPFAKLIKHAVDKLSGYQPQSNYVPAAIPGLRYYGQLLSSFGQHEAFLGNPEKACIYFDEAIRCFERLSEKNDKDIDQTMTYRVTADMDADFDSPNAKTAIEQYLKGPLPDAAARLAADNSKDEKYHHHILLRYLVGLPSDNEAVSAYLNAKDTWKSNYGHPWELIEFYRAMLLANPTEKMERLQEALRIALDGGPTLRIIASVIAGSIYFYEQTDKSRSKFENISEQAIKEIPDLGEERVAALRNHIKTPFKPLALAKIILPFNFR